MTDEKKQQIKNILYDAGLEFIAKHELNHAAEIVIKNPTEAGVLEAQKYLDDFPYYRFGQTQMMPTSTQKGLAGNAIKYAFSEIRKVIS